MSTPMSPGGAGASAPCQPSSSVESSGYTEPNADPGLLLSVTRSSLLARRLLRLRTCRSHVGPVMRRKREMIPADKKDSTYWDKRRKNNEAAKRSREKRRLNDLMLEGQLLALSEENAQLRAHMLSLQYHTSLTAEKCNAASAGATTTPSVLASTLSLSPRPAHTAALFQAGHWGNSRSAPASILGVRPQEIASHPFEANAPCFSSTKGAGGFNPLSPHNCGAQQGVLPLPGSRVISPRAAVQGGRSAEGEVDAQRQVSSSDDIPNSTAESSSHPASSVRAILPTPDTLQHASSTLAYTHQNWLVPHLSHSAVCNNLLLPWRSSYLPPPAVCPGLPLYIHERQGQGLVAEADIQRGFRGRFSSAPAGLTQLGMHFSPDGH
ncbi:nuclear factor interleukin-3-regulated protein [Trachinotus anak]|uniref:nuclear factor interleukin-3-regulated protein n=1 Tax=Trachinotus anak TaxID=443729 RepID=UPI0039F24AA7